MIVVLDTNIWISALFFGGKPEQALLKAFEVGDVVVCQQLVDEIKEVAVRKFYQRAERVRERLEHLLAGTTWIRVEGTLAHKLLSPAIAICLNSSSSGEYAS